MGPLIPRFVSCRHEFPLPSHLWCIIPLQFTLYILFFQLAQRAQKKSVEPDEVKQYELYNEKHGAKYVSEADGVGEGEDMEEW